MPESRDWLVTDGLRHRERNVGRVRDNLSQTLAADERPRQDRPASDILPFSGPEHLTVAAYRGIRGVTASSSAGFADSVRASDPSSMPFAAIDGDPYSAWQSSTLAGPAGQWLEVGLDTPRVVDQVALRMVDDIRVGWPVTRIRITTDSGFRDHEVARGTAEQAFAVSPGLTSRVRITVLSVAAQLTSGSVGIAELSVPGVTAQRALRVPTDVLPGPNSGRPSPSAAALSRATPAPAPTATSGATWDWPGAARNPTGSTGSSAPTTMPTTVSKGRSCPPSAAPSLSPHRG